MNDALKKGFDFGVSRGRLSWKDTLRRKSMEAKNEHNEYKKYSGRRMLFMARWVEYMKEQMIQPTSQLNESAECLFSMSR